jgi:hypothetical protein
MTATEVMEYFETADLAQAQLVLELAAGKLEARSAKTSQRSAAAKRRWAKKGNAAPVQRKRRTFPATASQEAAAESTATSTA